MKYLQILPRQEKEYLGLIETIELQKSKINELVYHINSLKEEYSWLRKYVEKYKRV